MASRPAEEQRGVAIKASLRALAAREKKKKQEPQTRRVEEEQKHGAPTPQALQHHFTQLVGVSEHPHAWNAELIGHLRIIVAAAQAGDAAADEWLRSRKTPYEEILRIVGGVQRH